MKETEGSSRDSRLSVLSVRRFMWYRELLQLISLGKVSEVVRPTFNVIALLPLRHNNSAKKVHFSGVVCFESQSKIVLLLMGIACSVWLVGSFASLVSLTSHNEMGISFCNQIVSIFR